MKLDGKVALITGAGTGIGTAIAERFVADGAKICITGRRPEMLDEVTQSLPAGTVVTCAGDVTKPVRRTAHPTEISGLCSYLASDDSTFMTGAALLIDGGAAIVDVAGAALTNIGMKWGV